jgi:hypothetical protein
LNNLQRVQGNARKMYPSLFARSTGHRL